MRLKAISFLSKRWAVACAGCIWAADATEYVSVVGTDAFMDFVESIKAKALNLNASPWATGTGAKAPIIIEVDNENTKKDVEKLDIEIPVLTPRVYREYKNLEELIPATFNVKKVDYKQFSEEEKREIVFKDITTGKSIIQPSLNQCRYRLPKCDRLFRAGYHEGPAPGQRL